MGRVPLLKDVWQDCLFLLPGPLIAREAAVETTPLGILPRGSALAAPDRGGVAGPVWLFHLALEGLFPRSSPGDTDSTASSLFRKSEKHQEVGELS